MKRNKYLIVILAIIAILVPIIFNLILFLCSHHFFLKDG